jgi:two-component system, LytTR family, sensor histidine kinase AlgZ
MTIINQNPVHPPALPNFRNLGVMLRILVIVNALSAVAALLKAGVPGYFWRELIDVSAIVQPVLLASLLALYAFHERLARLPYAWGAAGVVVIELALTTLVAVAGRQLFGTEPAALERYWLFCLIVSGYLLGYFHLRGRALSPALGEARLQALQARIRPHFLFNSINAVLSLIRSDPKRAEQALMDMADLFRVLMADNRQLSPLADEINLCRQYLALEQLRLGERLQIAWHIDKMPQDALIPPLVLQPLLENAVYHGIEPMAEPGEVRIDIYRKRDEVHIVLANPYRPDGDHHAGNKMALANIRERLQLHFDAEAGLTTKTGDGAYQVHIVIPYTEHEPAKHTDR